MSPLMCMGSLVLPGCLRFAAHALGSHPGPSQLPMLFLRNTQFHSAWTMLSRGQCRGSAQAVAATRTFCMVSFKLLLGKIGQECWMKMGKLWQQAVYRLQFV